VADPAVGDRRGVLDLATAIALFLLGMAYGGWAVWAVPVRLFGGVEGLSIVITVVGTFGAGLLAAWGLQTWRAALLPIAGWFVVTAVLSLMVGPGGDILVPGGLPADPGVVKVGEFNWLAGFLASAGVMVLAAFWSGLYRRSSRYTSTPDRPRQPQ